MNDRYPLHRQAPEEDTFLRSLLEADCQLEGTLLLAAYQASAEDYLPPEALDQQCRALIQRHFRNRKRHRRLLQLIRSAACFLLVLTASVLLTLCISPEARAAASKWISGWDGGLYVYAPTDTDEVTPDYNYRLSRLPDGYLLDQEFFVPTGGVVTYYSEEAGHSLHLIYCRQDEGSEFGLVLTEESHKPVVVNGIRADLYYYPDLHDDSSLVWVDPETNYLLHISGYFPEEEMVAIAQSVVRTMRQSAQ